MENRADLSEAPNSLKVHLNEGEEPCAGSDNPDKTDADHLELIREAIDSQGWFIQYVEKGRWSPAFAYTVGLTRLGHPELLVTGLRVETAGRFLNPIAHGLVVHGTPAYVAGDRHTWPGRGAVEVVDVAEPTVHLFMATAIYGPDLHAVQLVYADDRGHWPWQVGFRGNQSVLGPRAKIWTAQ